ncbi:hypothetical protein L9F63_018068 [Diploptera punctata]|uniref:Carbohydrate kinase PfkB domain-containing protein n=1 Tax=Diploptera punctata TaxID=6984 RepID=A0AAD7ZXE0_DIPPU|nr:hypothetical protein L9F63_018068 [Diploptera punctata]
MRKAGKVFQCRHWTSLSYVSPNLNELQVMAQASGLFYSLSQFDSNYGDESVINEASFLARSLVEHIGTAIVTMGRLGILVVREGEADEPMLKPCRSIPHTNSKISVRYYPVPFDIAEQKIVNVSGAGDCLAAGMLESMLHGHTEKECVASGFLSASWALQSSSAVPDNALVSDIPKNVEFTVIHS